MKDLKIIAAIEEAAHMSRQVFKFREGSLGRPLPTKMRRMRQGSPNQVGNKNPILSMAPDATDWRSRCAPAQETGPPTWRLNLEMQPLPVADPPQKACVPRLFLEGGDRDWRDSGIGGPWRWHCAEEGAQMVGDQLFERRFPQMQDGQAARVRERGAEGASSGSGDGR